MTLTINMGVWVYLFQKKLPRFWDRVQRIKEKQTTLIENISLWEKRQREEISRCANCGIVMFEY